MDFSAEYVDVEYGRLHPFDNEIRPIMQEAIKAIESAPYTIDPYKYTAWRAPSVPSPASSGDTDKKGTNFTIQRVVDDPRKYIFIGSSKRPVILTLKQNNDFKAQYESDQYAHFNISDSTFTVMTRALLNFGLNVSDQQRHLFQDTSRTPPVPCIIERTRDPMKYKFTDPTLPGPIIITLKRKPTTGNPLGFGGRRKKRRPTRKRVKSRRFRR